jgi:hypothetical protein
MNGLRDFIEQDFDIVDKAKQETRNFVMKVDILFLHQLGAAHFTEDSHHNRCDFLRRLPIAIG